MRMLALATLFVGSIAAQTADTAYFQTRMLPSNEVPAITTFDTSGLGTIVAHVVRDTSGKIVSGSVDFWIDYNYPQALTASGLHIHAAPAGMNGAIVIATGISGGSPYTDATGVGRVERQAQVLPGNDAGVAALRQMFENPSQFYVNMHSTEYPGGFMRGQLQPANVTRVIGLMSGTNEVPAVSTGNTATAVVTSISVRDSMVGFTSGSVIFDVNYTAPSAVTFTGLHIHKGGAGVNGSIEIPTTLRSVPSDSSGQGNLHYAVNADVSSAAVQDALDGLINNPGGYYINYHSTVNPGGAARSQLLATDQLTIPVTLSPANEVPAITGLAASGPGRIVVNTARAGDGSVIAGAVTFDVDYRFPSAVTITGFHIHNGAAGVNGPVIINTGVSGGTPVPTDDSGQGALFRTVTVGDAAGIATLNSIEATPELQYVNLHTTTNPGGAIRSPLGSAPSGPPVISAIINAVNDPTLKTVAPGELISIYGLNLARNGGDLQGLAGSSLPTALDGLSVSIGGQPAPILYVSPTQANVQVPFETASGTQAVTVTSAGTAATKAFSITVAPAAPGVFFDSVGGVVVRNADYSLIRPDNPARAGEVLLIYCTGLGQATPALVTGQKVSGISNIAGVTATLNDIPVQVVYAVASPQFVGLYQVAITVPAGAVAGNQRLKILVNNVASNSVLLPLAPAGN